MMSLPLWMAVQIRMRRQRAVSRAKEQYQSGAGK